MTRITLRAKSDGTEISGELVTEGRRYWDVCLASNTPANSFWEDYWDRVYALPTTPGTVFRATVRGVENVRVMTMSENDVFGAIEYSDSEANWSQAADIDASTVVIELEGDA